jgi:outer membrane lipoprotein-sorting protein
MISGARRFLFLVVFICTAHAEAWNVQSLMQELAQIPASSTRFVETRHLAILTRPLELKGTLSYERPNRLSKHVEAPYDELMTVHGDSATLVNKTKGEQRVVSLREQPAMAALVESVRSTLAGDLPQLEKHYRVKFSGAREAWTLELVPRAAQVKSYVDTITLAGAGTRVTRIETLETGGDRSVMTIVHDGK